MSEAVKQYQPASQPAIRQHRERSASAASKGWRWWRWRCCFPREIEKVPPSKFGRWLQQTKKKLTRENSLLHPLSFCLLFPLFPLFPFCTHHHTAHKHPNTQTQSRHRLAQATKAAAAAEAVVPLLSFNYRPTSTAAGTAAAAATLAIE